MWKVSTSQLRVWMHACTFRCMHSPFHCRCSSWHDLKLSYFMFMPFLKDVQKLVRNNLTIWIFFCSQELMRFNDLIMAAIKSGQYGKAVDVLLMFGEFFEQPPYKGWIREHGGWVCNTRVTSFFPVKHIKNCICKTVCASFCYFAVNDKLRSLKVLGGDTPKEKWCIIRNIMSLLFISFQLFPYRLLRTKPITSREVLRYFIWKRYVISKQLISKWQFMKMYANLLYDISVFSPNR